MMNHDSKGFWEKVNALLWGSAIFVETWQSIIFFSEGLDNEIILFLSHVLIPL